MARTNEIVDLLKKSYPNPKCELHFENPYQLIVSVILSAQCTDKRVNMTTPTLFLKYPDAKSLANANLDDVEEIIKPCGFYHNKAKNIISMAQDVVNKFDGKIPSNKDDLKSLAGVGEKTANVVLATAFNVPAIAVDTHVFRVSNRLGLANSATVEKTQSDLEYNLKKQDWAFAHFALVLHGRYVCKSQKPKCDNCQFNKICKYYAKNSKNGAKSTKK